MNKRLLELLRGPYLLAVRRRGDTRATDRGPTPKLPGAERKAVAGATPESEKGEGQRTRKRS